MSLTYEAGPRGAGGRADRSSRSCAPLAGRCVELPALDEHYEPGARAALHHLERWLFEPAPPERIDPGDAVRLLEAGGERAEAELVAAEVLGCCAPASPARRSRSCTARWRAAAPLLERTCSRSTGSASRSERRVPFAHTALGRGAARARPLRARCRRGRRHRRRPARLPAYARACSSDPSRPTRSSADVSRRARCARRARRRRASGSVSTLREIDALRAAADPAAELLRQARRLLSRRARRDGALPCSTPSEELDARAVRRAGARARRALGARRSRPGRRADRAARGRSRRRPRPAVLDARGGAARRAARDPRRGASGRCSSADCRRASSRAPARPEPFLVRRAPARARAALAGWRCALDEDALGARALPVLRVRLARHRAASCSATAAPTRRATSRCPRRSSPTSPSCSCPSWPRAPPAPAARRRRLAGGRGADRPRARARRGWPRRGLVAAADPGGPPARGSLGDAALGHVRHSAGRVRPARSSRSPPARFKLAGRARAPARRARARPEPLVAGSFIHTVLERVLAGLGGAVTRGVAAASARAIARGADGESAGRARARQPAGRPCRDAAARDRGGPAALPARTRRDGGSGWAPAALELRFGFERGEEGVAARARARRRRRAGAGATA